MRARSAEATSRGETSELLAADCDVEVNRTSDTLTHEQLRTRVGTVAGLLVFMPDRITVTIVEDLLTEPT